MKHEEGFRAESQDRDLGQASTTDLYTSQLIVTHAPSVGKSDRRMYCNFREKTVR